MKVAREEHQKIEQLHLNDKRLLNDGLHAKDKQYTEVLRNMKLKHGEEVWWISPRIYRNNSAKEIDEWPIIRPFIAHSVS